MLLNPDKVTMNYTMADVVRPNQNSAGFQKLCIACQSHGDCDALVCAMSSARHHTEKASGRSLIIL